MRCWETGAGAGWICAVVAVSGCGSTVTWTCFVDVTRVVVLLAWGVECTYYKSARYSSQRIAKAEKHSHTGCGTSNGHIGCHSSTRRVLAASCNIPRSVVKGLVLVMLTRNGQSKQCWHCHSEERSHRGVVSKGADRTRYKPGLNGEICGY